MLQRAFICLVLVISLLTACLPEEGIMDGGILGMQTRAVQTTEARYRNTLAAVALGTPLATSAANELAPSPTPEPPELIATRIKDAGDTLRTIVTSTTTIVAAIIGAVAVIYAGLKKKNKEEDS